MLVGFVREGYRVDGRIVKDAGESVPCQDMMPIEWRR